MFDEYHQEYDNLMARAADQSDFEDAAEWMLCAQDVGERAKTEGAEWVNLAIVNQMCLLYANPDFWKTCRKHVRSLAVKHYARTCIAEISAYLADLDSNYDEVERLLYDPLTGPVMCDQQCRFAVGIMPTRITLTKNMTAAITAASVCA